VNAPVPAAPHQDARFRSRTWLAGAMHNMETAVLFLEGDELDHARIIQDGLRTLIFKLEQASREASGTASMPKITREEVR